MSRSRRKTPIRGVCGKSEKWDKVQCNRRMRKIVKSIINSGIEKEFPVKDEIIDDWLMNKDGKLYFGDLEKKDPEEFRKLKRK